MTWNFLTRTGIRNEFLLSKAGLIWKRIWQDILNRSHRFLQTALLELFSAEASYRTKRRAVNSQSGLVLTINNFSRYYCYGCGCWVFWYGHIYQSMVVLSAFSFPLKMYCSSSGCRCCAYWPPRPAEALKEECGTQCGRAFPWIRNSKRAHMGRWSRSRIDGTPTWIW